LETGLYASVPVHASGSLSMLGSPGQMTAANEGDGYPDTSFCGLDSHSFPTPGR